MNTIARQLPAYKSHKTVWALKIGDIKQSPAEHPVEGGSWLLLPEDERYGPIEVPHSYVQKHSPEAGGYYVQYEDGYKSYSPAKAFEEGYTPLAGQVVDAEVPRRAALVTDDMVDRFLSWPLPNDFAPDCYITFMPVPDGTWPVGTNLLSATQARKMLEHVLGVSDSLTPPYQQRVIAEKTELDGKLAALLTFFQEPIYEALPEAERSRLRNQARFMDGYAAVLGERIAAFTGGAA